MEDQESEEDCGFFGHGLELEVLVLSIRDNVDVGWWNCSQ